MQRKQKARKGDVRRGISQKSCCRLVVEMVRAARRRYALRFFAEGIAAKGNLEGSEETREFIKSSKRPKERK